MKDLIAKLHSDSADQILATFSTLEMQLQGFAKSSYEKDLRIAELEAQIADKADTDIPEALELLAAVFDAWENGDDCYEDPEECAGFLGKAFRLDDDIFNRCVELLNRRNPPRNAAPTALQAPVREVPEGAASSAITLPDSWLKVSEHGNPPDGLYMAIYKGDGKSLPVTLAGYGEYEFDSEDDEGEIAGIGWVEYSEDRSGDCFTIIRDVIAYIPVNLNMESLKAVRASLPAAPVQQEGE